VSLSHTVMTRVHLYHIWVYLFCLLFVMIDTDIIASRRVRIPAIRWRQQRCGRRGIRDPSPSADITQPRRAVCITGPLWGRRTFVSTSSRWLREDQRTWPSRCRDHAQHTGSCLSVSTAVSGNFRGLCLCCVAGGIVAQSVYLRCVCPSVTKQCNFWLS